MKNFWFQTEIMLISKLRVLLLLIIGFIYSRGVLCELQGTKETHLEQSGIEICKHVLDHTARFHVSHTFTEAVVVKQTQSRCPG